MEKFTKHTGKVVPLYRTNIDTDQIIPKQFLKKIERTGFGLAQVQLGCHHPGEGDEHRQRNRGGDHQTATHVAEHQEEHRHDEGDDQHIHHRPAAERVQAL